MRLSFIFIVVLFSITFPSHAGKANAARQIAREPVTMMDIGILKLNTSLSSQQYSGLRGATMGATYNARKGTIDIKVSKPVKKASKEQCKKIIHHAKKIFVRMHGKKKISNIHHYFQHEGSGYTRRVNWDDLAHRVIIIGIALTGRNYHDSVFCQANLMKDKITF